MNAFEPSEIFQVYEIFLYILVNQDIGKSFDCRILLKSLDFKIEYINYKNTSLP